MSICKGYLTTFKLDDTNNLYLHHEHSTRVAIKLHQTKKLAIQRYIGQPVTNYNLTTYNDRHGPLYLVEFDVVLVNEIPVLDYLSN
jgi:hypothetical protein